MSNIRSIISEAIVRRLSDPRIAPITSITRVELSPDFQFAKLFISVVGTEGQQRSTLSGLRHARGHLQSILAKELMIRTCPIISFEEDLSLKQAQQTLDIIKDAQPESPQPGEENTE